MRKFLAVTLSLFTLVAILAVSGPSLALDPRTHGPRIRNKDGTSTNWSGYAAIGSNTTYAKGSWVVPSLTCTGTNTYSSAWVGLDGYNDNTVEQTGTEHDCNGTSSSYYAWFEMYPKPVYLVPLTVNAGDNMTAEVKYLGSGSFQLTLTDVTSGASFNTIQRQKKAQRQSAEWIMEAPFSGGVLPLANFGTANFSGSNATLNGTNGSIKLFPNDQINMVNSSGGLKATTSSLSPDGTGFSVTWVASN